MSGSTAAYLYLSQFRTSEPVGHAYRAPKPCADCGRPVEELRGMTRDGVRRCGPCDIAYCDGADRK